jgi:putative tricarboxylic transport membrane protein
MTNQINGLSKIHYTDYTPVALLFNEHSTLVVPAGSSIKSVHDIIQKLKADPQALSVAVGFSVGGINHLGLGLLLKQGGVDVRRLKTVVFQGQGATLTALMGGHVDYAPMQVATALRAAQGGKLRILGIAAERRGEGALAEIPTWKEQGLDLVWSNVRYVIGPKGMTPAQLAYWDGVLRRVTQSEEWREEGRKNHLHLDYLDSRQTPQRLATVYQQLRGAAVDVGLVKE